MKWRKEDSDNTGYIRLTGYIGCTSEETAAQAFMETKQLYGKFGGRVCYHGYQSFAADEVDAHTAYEIGAELERHFIYTRINILG